MAKKRKHAGETSTAVSKDIPKTTVASNPLLDEQLRFLDSLSEKERNSFFAPNLDPSRRAELWMQQADLGERLVNSYSWATPNDRAMRVLKHFAPIVEIASGQGYWLRMMKEHGIDAVGYDIDPSKGGKIAKDNSSTTHGTIVKKGGPEVLERAENRRRTLFLCYPDEDTPASTSDQGTNTQSLASACLKHYKGDYVIHVGELFMDATLSMDQAPWGRSSSPSFQEQLAAQFHCVAKISLPSWLHVRDTLSVWKRSQVCSIVFEAEDGDDDGDEEYEYRHIPAEERLPVDITAPCLRHLLEEKDMDGVEVAELQKAVSPAVKTDIKAPSTKKDYKAPW
ncbi:hypothetical protein MPSEU_000791400 [Mayamaea pseudoterrestris]|nr:hypothetical protein MPSEU_000791400 [Mayamaea pseudoterrestris]